MTRSFVFYAVAWFITSACSSVASVPQGDQRTMELAERDYQQKNWRAAAAALDSITAADPSNSLAWLHLGISRQELAQYDQAIAAYKHIENDPSFGVRALYREAVSLAKTNRNSEALNVLDKAVAAGFARPETIQQEPDFAPLRGDPQFAKIVSKADMIAHPCAYQPQYREFDFWIGEWEVVTTQGHDPAGTSSIQLILDKCVLLENWTGGGTGKSFNHYDTTRKMWIQDWVDNQSNSIHFEGGLEDGVMSFYADNVNSDGSHSRRHLQFFKLDAEHVRQFSQQSTDGGKTWSVEYDLTYNRKK